MSSVVETVTEMVTPILDEQHFELVEVEFVKEGKSWFLRVFIDKKAESISKNVPLSVRN